MRARTPTRVRLRSETGASAVEYALVAATLITVVVVILGYSFKLHGKQVVTYAAEDALAVAEQYGATAAQAQAAAQHDIDVLGGNLHNVSITVTFAANTATVTVSGETQEFTPLIAIPVASTVSAPREQLAPGTG